MDRHKHVTWLSPILFQNEQRPFIISIIFQIKLMYHLLWRYIVILKWIYRWQRQQQHQLFGIWQQWRWQKMDPLMKELIRVTDSYKCAIKGTGTANPSKVHEIIQHIYRSQLPVSTIFWQCYLIHLPIMSHFYI